MPVEAHVTGQSAGDSTLVGGRWVARTRAALRPVYSLQRGALPLYPGERVVVGVREHRLGLAVFDGCRLVPEWAGPERIPELRDVRSFTISDAERVPPLLRDPRGYRAFDVTALKSESAAPAS